MSLRPDFSKAQVRALEKLGLCEPQISELRGGLISVWRTLSPPPGNNDVRERLNKVADLSRELTNILAMLAVPQNAVDGSACALIAERYWEMRPADEGPTAMHHLIPRLEALSNSAKEGAKALPAKPARHHRASPFPIKQINNGLIYGWAKASSRVMRGPANSTKERLEQFRALPPSPGRYPAKFKPSDGVKSSFRQIVGICYEAAGAGIDADPLRAIRAFLEAEKKQRAAALLAFEAGISSLKVSPRPKGKQKVPK